VGGVVTYDRWFEQQDVWGDAGGDAMYFTYLTMQTFRDSFGRNSYDGSGAEARVVVNDGDRADTSPWVNEDNPYPAHAPGHSVAVFRIIQNARHASAALDSVAHEWGHAIAFSLASPPAYDWCNSIGGQLHEGFADVIGHFVERKRQPIWPFGGFAYETAEWIFMEDARRTTDPAYRRVDIDDRPPDYLFHRNETAANSYCQSHGYPSPYEEAHQRGNMLPVTFWLLASGGVNPSCAARGLGCGISVTGQGLDKAGKILYRMWTSYVQANADWYMLLDMAKTAAYDLYKNCPSYSAIPEQQSVEQAFNAIGYGSPGYYHTCP
jgi:Zn-dependent metalloprotease